MVRHFIGRWLVISGSRPYLKSELAVSQQPALMDANLHVIQGTYEDSSEDNGRNLLAVLAP
jgi:hypothetical protein